MVPILTWGLLRSNFFFAIAYLQALLILWKPTSCFVAPPVRGATARVAAGGLQTPTQRLLAACSPTQLPPPLSPTRGSGPAPPPTPTPPPFPAPCGPPPGFP